MKKITLGILIIFLSLFCLSISIEQHSFDKTNYMYNYSINNVEEITGRSIEELSIITDKLIEYIKGNAGEEALRPHYNEKEILHMEDVQVLFNYTSKIKYITMALSLIMILFFMHVGEKDLLGKYIFKGIFANWIIVGLLALVAFFDFNKYFTYFHLIFFTNDLWLLDPRTDLLIQMLPEEFFIDMAKQIGLSFLMYMATIQGIGWAIYKKGRKKDEKRIKLFKRQDK